jgi:hypothetical protein
MQTSPLTSSDVQDRPPDDSELAVRFCAEELSRSSKPKIVETGFLRH